MWGCNGKLVERVNMIYFYIMLALLLTKFQSAEVSFAFSWSCRFFQGKSSKATL